MSDYEVISVKNTYLGTEIELIPAYGGRLNKLLLSSNGTQFDLIQESQANADLSQLSRFNAVPLFPFPNRLDKGKWIHNGKELAFPQNEPDKQNALHGFLYYSPFEIVENHKDHDGIVVCLKYDYNGSLNYYPFPFEIKQTFTCKSSDQLDYEITFTNMGEEKAPFGFGWHPYFRFNNRVDNLYMKMPVTEEILVDERQLPTGQTVPETYFSKGNLIGERTLDTCFRILSNGKSETIIRDLEKSFEFKLTQSEIFRYLQIYTKPHRKSIAIEPVTSNINMLQNHQHELYAEPGETVGGNISISIKT